MPTSIVYIDVPRASVEAVAARHRYLERQVEIGRCRSASIAALGHSEKDETSRAASEEEWPVDDSLRASSRKRKRIASTSSRSRDSDIEAGPSNKMTRYVEIGDSGGETSNARRGRLVRRASSGASSLADDVNRLGADDEILKILGRVRDENGIYVYTVKLQDGRRAQVGANG